MKTDENKNEILTKDYWENEYWVNLREKTSKSQKIPFANLFAKVLKQSANRKIALEIGCVPGFFLAHICKNFGYYPEGIDYVNNSIGIVQKTLKEVGIENSKIYQEDFTTWRTKKKYDLVCSFGFIEHFRNPIPVVSKHIELLKKGGTLILEIPNFNNGQKFLRKLLDRENLHKHNIEIMEIDFFKEICEEYNLHIEYLGYYGGLFTFWWENKSPNKFQKYSYFFLKKLSQITKRININNKYFSPYIILVAKKL